MIRTKNNYLYEQPAIVKADMRRGKVIWIKGEAPEGRLLLNKNRKIKSSNRRNSARISPKTPINKSDYNSLLKNPRMEVLGKSSFVKKTTMSTPK